MMKYLASQITVYDEDKELFETHVGNENMELIYSGWGKTEEESRTNAESIVRLLGMVDDLFNIVATKYML